MIPAPSEKPTFLLVSFPLYASNGEFLATNDHRWEFSDGTVFMTAYEYRQHYGKIMVVQTPKIVQDPANKLELVEAIKAGKLNMFPFLSYRGKNAVERLLQQTLRDIKQEEQRAAFNAKVAELESEYPQLPDDLKEAVRDFDYYYEMADDISVWRRGRTRENELVKQLTAVGADKYMDQYRALLNERSKTQTT